MQPFVIIIPVIDRSQIPVPEKDRGPLINWTQKRDSLIYQAEQKKIRPLGEEDRVRVLQLEDYITLLRSLSWDGKGKAPELPLIPGYQPPPTEAAVPIPEVATPDPRDAELAALRARVAELEQPEAPLLPAPDALMSDYGPVGGDDITGDMLLDAFEENEAETVAVVQTLSALRLKHLSEQLNVERARLDREHQATGVANPRSASIDRLLGLLTRRGEV
jgi:hypothetical protein